MKERTYGIILGILNIVLLIVCGVFFVGKDRNAPEILLPKGSIVYAEEAGTEVLFEGVVAMDEEDGDLTDSVVIEKIVANEEKETASITYGVADSAGNVGKVTCTVTMVVEETEKLSEEEDGTEGSEAEGQDSQESEEDVESLEEDEESGERSSEETNDDTEESSGTEDNGEETEEGSSAEENEEDSQEVGDETDTDENANAAGNSEESGEADREALPTAGEAGNRGQTVASQSNTGRPTMTFKTREVKVKAGSTPAWVDVLEGLHDDKDDYGTLLKTLKINGEYNKDKAGTYPVTLTIKDSDGNESNAYALKIIVEEWN